MQTDRLTTIHEDGSRKFVIPAEVSGRYRTFRNRVYFFLVLIFLGLPWIKINGLQAVLLDFPNRHFEIFGQLFLAHDSPLVFLLIAILVMGLAFVTAVWGRVWCGWACPQTVFIDGLYRKIEILIVGDYKVRRRLKREGMSSERIFKSTLKWLAFLILSSLLAHSFIAYFSGSARLLEMIQGSPQENRTYFLLVSSATVLLLFNFGWFREQFCTIMCPYGRFQSVLMDDQSLTILYDEKRGEPRKGVHRDAVKRGDCVNCNRCVEVCPAGIDIRNGVQMECIGCTACIDACNEIMKRVQKPPDLIRYASVKQSRFRIWRPRTIGYMGILLICGSALAFSFATHSSYSVTLLRAKDTPYQLLPGDVVLNHLKAHIFNQSQADVELSIALTPKDIDRGVKLTQVKELNRVRPAEAIEAHFFITFPKAILNCSGELGLKFLIKETYGGSYEEIESTVVGPNCPK